MPYARYMSMPRRVTGTATLLFVSTSTSSGQRFTARSDTPIRVVRGSVVAPQQLQHSLSLQISVIPGNASGQRGTYRQPALLNPHL